MKKRQEEGEHLVPKKRVADCIVKNTKRARRRFIGVYSNLLENNDEEHQERYERLWEVHDNDYPEFLRSTYHNITKSEFKDFVLLMTLSHYGY